MAKRNEKQQEKRIEKPFVLAEKKKSLKGICEAQKYCFKIVAKKKK